MVTRTKRFLLFFLVIFFILSLSALVFRSYYVIDLPASGVTIQQLDSDEYKLIFVHNNKIYSEVISTKDQEVLIESFQKLTGEKVTAKFLEYASDYLETNYE